MEIKEILKTVDHTLLLPASTWSEIKEILDDAMKYETASACIPASFVKRASEYVDGKLAICTVIGFPNGYSTTATKVFETKDAIQNGATEIDMVINIALAKEAKFDQVEDEIRAVRAEIPAGKILKVIIESAALTDEEIVAVCRAAVAAGADFVKTSTGFHPAGGASVHAVELMRQTVGENVGVKASGGIRDAQTAIAMIEAGANRLGVSATAAILAGLED